MNCNICGEINRWLKQPFKPEGSIVDWFLFAGLIIVIIFLWQRILVRIAP